MVQFVPQWTEKLRGAESRRKANRRKARKRRKRRKAIWGDSAKKSVQSAAAQLVVDNGRLVRSGLQRKLYIINKL